MSLATAAVDVGNQYRILVIDDAMSAARPILSQLADAGYECHYAPGGVPGLAAFHELKPHLILLDLTMPDMPGSEVCSRIRETSTVPIIVLTETESAPNPTRRIVANEFAPKTLQPAALMARVERLLECVYRNARPSEEITWKRTPSGWATCEACSYMGPREKFTTVVAGESHLACPNCQRDDSIIVALA